MAMRLRNSAISMGGLIAFGVIWEIVGRMVDRTYLSPLTVTLARAYELFADGTMLGAIWNSLSLFLAGFSVATVVGIAGGVLLARVSWLRTGLEGYVTMMYATPMVAVIPFILAMLGFGFFPKALVVFLFGVFPILINTMEGARSINPELLDVAAAYRSSERHIWVDVILPYTLPFAMTGVRQGIARGLVGMVAAEFLLNSNGLGRVIIISSQRFDTAAVLACVLLITVLGVVLMSLGRFLESLVATWRVAA
jgi:ABC-type nitrate/sulfonate/bicarbonate transport system permease component